MIMRMVVDLPAPFGPRNPVRAGRDREAEGVHGGGVTVALRELVCLDHDRDRSGGWGGTECSAADAEAGDRARGWGERRMVGWGRAVMPAAACGAARCRGWLPGSPAMRCGARSRRTAG